MKQQFVETKRMVKKFDSYIVVEFHQITNLLFKLKLLIQLFQS